MDLTRIQSRYPRDEAVRFRVRALRLTASYVAMALLGPSAPTADLYSLAEDQRLHRSSPAICRTARGIGASPVPLSRWAPDMMTAAAASAARRISRSCSRLLPASTAAAANAALASS